MNMFKHILNDENNEEAAVEKIEIFAAKYWLSVSVSFDDYMFDRLKIILKLILLMVDLRYSFSTVYASLQARAILYDPNYLLGNLFLNRNVWQTTLKYLITS